MRPARKFSATMRNVLATGLTAFTMTTQATALPVAPPAPPVDIVAKFKEVEVFPAPYTDHVVVRDNTTRVVAPCAEVRKPVWIKDQQAFMEAQASAMLSGGGIYEPTDKEMAAARKFIQEAHNACGLRPARPAFSPGR